MPSPLIKICGVANEDAVRAAIAGQASHIGLNFFPPSPRAVDARAAARLSEAAGQRIQAIGVFVDPDDGLLAEMADTGGLDAIQLHGEESPQRAAQVRQRFGKPVWKVLPVAAADDVARAHQYRDAADFILFDAKTPKGSILPGGMGLTFDWGLVKSYRGPLPWGLAGGLDPSNVAQAVAATGAPLVDVSSGVESAPGVKDVDKIAAFCQAARQS